MKQDERNTVKCSFCGKTQDQVKRLIAGPNDIYICNECISLCETIISEEMENEAASGDIILHKPKEMKEILDQYVIGQDAAKKNTSGRSVQSL